LGAQIGNYKIVSVLGKGGFATVYKARDVKLGCDIALKFLRDPFDQKHRELFEREAKALGTLVKNDFIVRIHAWGEHQDRAYFALELVDSSAQKLLAKKDGVDVTTALRVMAQSAEAVAYAHKQGILHRDIKPGNILIDDDGRGRAKIADFGLARFYGSGQVSREGAISGSLHYMSPEQASGDEHLDEKTDIYSLGVTLYELLSGKRFIEGEGQNQILGRVREGKGIPLRTRKPDLPQPILDVVDKATAFDPADRYDSAEDLANELWKHWNKIRAGEPLTSGSEEKVSGLLAKVSRVVVAVAIVVVLGWVWMSVVNDGKDSPLLPAPPALAEANKKLDMGEFNEAEKRYRQILSEDPAEDDAIYGLAYSLLHQAKTDEAEAEFGKVSAEALRAEGQAAVAYERDPESARQVLESFQETVPTGYPQTLLAAMDVFDGQCGSAVQRLKGVDSSKLKFNWQRDKYRQTLGQAYYHLGDYEAARGIFEDIDKSASPAALAVAGAYIELAKSRADEDRREGIRNQVARIKELMDKEDYQPADEDVLWTSRPLRFFLLPANPGRSRMAVESGFADYLPSMLGETLVNTTPMTKFDRALIDEILAEQELSEQLGSGSGKLLLGRVLGARFIIECSFRSLFRDDFLSAKIVDVETTAEITPEEVGLPRGFDPKKVVSDLSSLVWESVSRKYPLRGRLYTGEKGPEISIGSSVGVQEGMRFKVLTEPKSRYRLPNKSVIAQGPIWDETSVVRLDGFSVEHIPAEGWYVEEEKTES